VWDVGEHADHERPQADPGERSTKGGLLLNIDRDARTLGPLSQGFVDQVDVRTERESNTRLVRC
jgi:hypothetical protein